MVNKKLQDNYNYFIQPIFFSYTLSFQVIVFQIQTVENETKQALATILPAITGAILAIQLKLKWAEKSQKCKKGKVEILK